MSGDRIPDQDVVSNRAARRPLQTFWLKVLRRRSPLYLHIKLYCVAALVSIVTARPVSQHVEVDPGRKPPVRVHWHRRTRIPERRDGPRSVSRELFRRWTARVWDLAQVKQLVRQSSQDKRRFPELQRSARVRCGHEPSPEKHFLKARREAILPHLSQYLSIKGVCREAVPIIAIGGSGGGFRAMLSYAAFLDGLKQAGIFDLASFVSGVSGSCWAIASLYTHAGLSTEDVLRHYEAVAQEEAHPMSLAALDKVARSRRGNYFLFGPLIRRGWEGARGGGLMDLYSTLTTGYLLLPRANSRGDDFSTGLSRSGMLWSRVYERCALDKGAAPLPVLTAARIVLDQDIAMASPAQYRQSPPAIEHTPRGRTAGRTKFMAEWWDISPLETGSADVTRYVIDEPTSPAIQRAEGSYIPTWAFGRQFVNGASLQPGTPELCLSLLMGHCTSAPAGPLTGYISALLSTLPTRTVMSWALRKFNAFLLWKTWRRRWGNPIRSSKEWNPFWGMSTKRSFSHTEAGSMRPMTDSTTRDSHCAIQPSASCQLRSAGLSESTQPPFDRSRSSEDHRRTTDQHVDSLRKVKLADAGISNNLPAHVFYTSQRKADIFIGYDASSDVQTMHGCLERVKDFGDERGLEFELAEESSDFRAWCCAQDTQHKECFTGRLDAQFMQIADEIDRREEAQAIAAGAPDDGHGPTETRQRLIDRFWASGRDCIVFNGFAAANNAQPSSGTASAERGHDGRTEQHRRTPDFVYIYIPLLPCPDLLLSSPRQSRADYVDPARSQYATSYNLLWTQKQARNIFATVLGNMAFDFETPTREDRLETELTPSTQSRLLNKIRRVVRRVARSRRDGAFV